MIEKFTIILFIFHTQKNHLKSEDPNMLILIPQPSLPYNHANKLRKRVLFKVLKMGLACKKLKPEKDGQDLTRQSPDIKLVYKVAIYFLFSILSRVVYHEHINFCSATKLPDDVNVQFYQIYLDGKGAWNFRLCHVQILFLKQFENVYRKGCQENI